MTNIWDVRCVDDFHKGEEGEDDTEFTYNDEEDLDLEDWEDEDDLEEIAP